jgi:hypothetical protein
MAGHLRSRQNRALLAHLSVKSRFASGTCASTGRPFVLILGTNDLNVELWVLVRSRLCTLAWCKTVAASCQK